MLPLYILKIGGSCLTYKKEQLKKVRNNFLSRIVKEIILAQRHHKFSLIIIHGGGSITHPLLDLYNIANKCKTGIISSQEEKVSAAKIHLVMNVLNKKVTQSFLDQGLPAWPIQTSAIFTSSNRNLENIFFESIKIALGKNYIPILHGDFILDHKSTISICSGDLVACILAKKLNGNKILFASDVDGVFTDDPQTSATATLLHSLNTSKFKIKTKNRFDHSGGMATKLGYIKEYCSEKDVMIFNGLVKGHLEKALLGKHVGTIITV